MDWAKYEPLRSRTDALDPLRNRIAELSVGGSARGLLSVRIETYWSESAGRLWWKVWSGAHEVLVWELTWIEDGIGYMYDDGLADSSDPFVNELLGGAVTLYGDTYQVRWLSADELEKAEVVMGVAGLWPNGEKSLDR